MEFLHPSLRTLSRWGMALAGVILVFLLVDKVLMPWYVHHGSVETVPNVTGMKLEQAKAVLTQLEFEVHADDVRYDNKYPAGTVINQTPYANAKVKEGRRVYLIASGGQEMLRVPPLVGKTLRDARIELSRVGIDVGNVQYQFHDTIPEGNIISQSLPPGSSIRAGEGVGVVLSQGKEFATVPVPDVIGSSLTEAQTILNAKRLIIGKVIYNVYPNVAPNTVIGQSPLPATEVREHSAVDVVLAEGQ